MQATRRPKTSLRGFKKNVPQYQYHKITRALLKAYRVIVYKKAEGKFVIVYKKAERTHTRNGVCMSRVTHTQLVVQLKRVLSQYWQTKQLTNLEPAVLFFLNF